MDTYTTIMPTVLKAINSSMGGFRAMLYSIHEEGKREFPIPVYLGTLLATVCALFLWVIISGQKRDAHNEKANRALHARNQQLLAQMADINDTPDETSSIDNDASSAAYSYSDTEDKRNVIIHRTVINFTAPMSDVHLHSFGHGSEFIQERLLPTMAGYGTQRLLGADDDSGGDDEDEDDDNETSEEESDEDEA